MALTGIIPLPRIASVNSIIVIGRRTSGCVAAAALLMVAAINSVARSGFAIDEKSFAEAIALREQGEFEKASRAFRTMLDQTTPTLEAHDRRTLEFEIERIGRIRQDYKLTREKLMQNLQRKLTSISEEEVEKYEREGKFDVQVIDGQKRYVNSSVSNLILRAPELRERLRKREPDTMYRRLYNEMLRVREAQKNTSSALVLPQDVAVTYTLVVEPNAAPAGKALRCWLPYPRAFPQQSDAYVLATTPTQYVLSPLEAPHRTVYLEATAEKDQPTTFAVSFVYRSWSRAYTIDPALVQPCPKDSPAYAYAVERKPHIDFANEELKKLNAEITAGETNPYLLARRIYDWISNNTIYQYAREYSTLDNISYYTAARRAGDCGQHGMLFIALCRLNGIPARWTTGWEWFNKDGSNMHDWCEFYVEPYGWLPADPDIAVNLRKHVDGELNTTQCQELCDWLFGNMDNLRLTVNSDFSAPLFPAKADFRSETVDFQRGEVEADGHNIYFDKWDYTMQRELLSPDQAALLAARFVSTEPAGALPLKGTYLEATTATLAATAPADKSTSEPVATPAKDVATSTTDASRTAPTSAAGGETSAPVQIETVTSNTAPVRIEPVTSNTAPVHIDPVTSNTAATSATAAP
jgi:transglutaminase-like putative cysteine protease